MQSLVNTGPLVNLLSVLCKLLLDDYVLEVITDSAVLTKLLISKLGNTSLRAQHIKTLRRIRNKIVHSIEISLEEIKKFYIATKAIQDWIQSSLSSKRELQELCITYCLEILSQNSVNTSEILPIITSEVLTFHQLKSKYNKEFLKGKSLRVHGGEYKDEIIIFLGWNGKNVKVSLNGVRKYMPMTREVEIVE